MNLTKVKLCFFLLTLSLSAVAQQSSLDLSKFTRYEGFFNFYLDEAQGEVWLEIPETRLDEEFIYVVGLPAGVGSNDIGLDRAQISSSRVVKFQRYGNKILLVEPNYAYRAISDSEMEVKAVEDAFAQSVLAGFEISDEQNQNAFINITYFLLRDEHGVARRLKATEQGKYSLDMNRSVIFPQKTKNFPDNSEFEAILTFDGNASGQYIRDVTPTATAVTVRQHHSFVKAPDDQYQPRKFDPRAGFFAISFADYAAPLNESLFKSYIARHRLEKVNPNAEKSEAVDPIIYYIDPATPPLIQQAMIEGASWWNEAFEEAGFINAFQVEILPEDADPMDVRYNVVTWVHRATRGWSYGNTVTDPRTGEIIKGHVTLGSLRLRQDYLIAEALLSPYEQENYIPDDMQEIALARLRQLVAHEIGHTLGLAHNFAASTVNRASVMDYPHPYFTLNSSEINWSDAYDTGIGEWDKIAIRYGYTQFSDDSDEQSGLDNILVEAHQQGIPFISDQDARPQGGAHPAAHLWDNGESIVEELNQVLAIRETALANFSENAIPFGTAYSQLEKTLVPLYLFHRYQTEATIKLIGGVSYDYKVRGDIQALPQVVENQTQEEALKAVLKTLSPEVLLIPEHIQALIPPPALYNGRDRESFEGYTGVIFDPIGAAQTAAKMTLTILLHPQRATRLIAQKSKGNQMMGLEEMLNKLESKTLKSSPQEGQNGEIQRVVNFVLLQQFIERTRNTNTSSQVQALVNYHLEELKNWCQNQSSKEVLWQAHYQFLADQIQLFQNEPTNYQFPQDLKTPAGSPIGVEEWCGW